MCTNQFIKTSVVGSGLVAGDWIDLTHAVVAFDHPQEAPLEHALCIDFRGAAAAADPSAHISLELDPESARRLAHSILATLASSECSTG